MSSRIAGKSKNVEYRWRMAIASYAAEFVRSYEKLHRACIELSFGFRVFTSRYFRLNKGACRPTYLPCPLFIPDWVFFNYANVLPNDRKRK